MKKIIIAIAIIYSLSLSAILVRSITESLEWHKCETTEEVQEIVGDMLDRGCESITIDATKKGYKINGGFCSEVRGRE